MSRTSYKEICPIYKQLVNEYPGITKEHIVKIFSTLNSRNPAIKLITREEKRKKKLIIDRLNTDSDIIQRYIWQIVPVDESNRRIYTIKKNPNISWKFLGELETSITQDEVGVMNILDQEDNLYNQGEVVVTNSLDQEGNLYNQGEVEYMDSLDQEGNLYNQGEVESIESLYQEDNLYNQGDVVVAIGLDQEGNLSPLERHTS